MANGQAVLPSRVLDVAEVDRLTARLEAGEADRHSAHAAQLRDALRLDRVYADAGLALQTTAVLALVWRCSEHRAQRLLHEAKTLRRLGALDVMTTGLLTVEPGRVVVEVLGLLEDDALALGVWRRLRARLEQDALVGALLPPARAAELLRRWLIEADADAAVRRRERAEKDRAGVQLWLQDEGLVDIAVHGVTGPNAEAIDQRLRQLATPIGLGDDRTAGERMRDAAVDSLLGRTALPFGANGGAARCDVPGCGCPQADPADPIFDAYLAPMVSRTLTTSPSSMPSA